MLPTPLIHSLYLDYFLSFSILLHQELWQHASSVHLLLVFFGGGHLEQNDSSITLSNRSCGHPPTHCLRSGEGGADRGHIRVTGSTLHRHRLMLFALGALLAASLDYQEFQPRLWGATVTTDYFHQAERGRTHICLALRQRKCTHASRATVAYVLETTRQGRNNKRALTPEHHDLLGASKCVYTAPWAIMALPTRKKPATVHPRSRFPCRLNSRAIDVATS